MSRRPLAVVLYAAVGLLAGCQYRPMETLDFESHRWKECDIRTSDARFRMVPTLVRDHNMVGMNEKQIEELLGDNAFRSPDGDRVCHHYPLGEPHEEWGSRGYPYLTIEFKQGRVTRVYQLAGMGAVADCSPLQP